jgi:aspartyl-tRNA(Asn)/glutamyl-tRNA(Gln) amidotransferase subunit C
MKGRRHIELETVDKVARLARIKLSEREGELFLRQFNDILDYFQKLNEADLEGVDPTFQVLELSNVFREDAGKEVLEVGEVLKNASKKEGLLFKAPKIM